MDSTVPEPAWLDVRGASQRALVSSSTILREVRAGRLRAVRVGGRRSLRFRPAWIDTWLLEGSEEFAEQQQQLAVRR